MRTANGYRIHVSGCIAVQLRNGVASEGHWDASEVPPGDYTLRVWASDAAGNETSRDVPVTVVRDEGGP
jgi:hypothetical protein